ncbi:MAG: class B sortase [Clostridiales bacterium]|nr:class B sortase [Clostridiales bacterium]
METAARLARAGNRILSAVAALMILLMFLYGGYSLWDTSMVYRGAFISDDLLQFKPVDTGEGQEENPTLEELQALNPDVRGWLTIDDTHIDYPVVQGETDMDYINKDVYGAFALSGSIFLSCLNSPDFSDGYSLVYGHHMDNGGMFGDVVEFADENYFEEHKTGTLYLPHGTYSIRLFACVETDAYDRVVYQPQAQEKGNVSELLTYLEEEAVQYREIGVEADDSVIGLSTCADAETNGRVIVFGRLEKISQTQEGGASNEDE